MVAQGAYKLTSEDPEEQALLGKFYTEGVSSLTVSERLEVKVLFDKALSLKRVVPIPKGLIRQSTHHNIHGLVDRYAKDVHDDLRSRIAAGVGFSVEVKVTYGDGQSDSSTFSDLPYGGATGTAVTVLSLASVTGSALDIYAASLPGLIRREGESDESFRERLGYHIAHDVLRGATQQVPASPVALPDRKTGSPW
jgi:hypothetical protein